MLHLLTRTRHLLGNKPVLLGTPGAVKVTVGPRHWYAYRRDGKRQIKARLVTDKATSLARLAKLNTALERGPAGMTDPRKGHLERPAREHLEEFLPVVRARGGRRRTRTGRRRSSAGSRRRSVRSPT